MKETVSRDLDTSEILCKFFVLSDKQVIYINRPRILPILSILNTFIFKNIKLFNSVKFLVYIVRDGDRFEYDEFCYIFSTKSLESNTCCNSDYDSK